MRIAVTGARGRLGTAVVDLAIRQGHEIVAIDNNPAGPDSHRNHPQVLTVDTDVTSYEALAAAVKDTEAIVHLAAYTSPRGRPAHVVHNANVVASYNALAAAMTYRITHVCQASSINAIGGAFSRRPQYDYFPIDEHHATYNEDPYSLSKWICEAQADSVGRRSNDMTIASLRLHRLVPDRAAVVNQLAGHSDTAYRDLWGYSTADAVARACLASLRSEWPGHEAFYIVAPQTGADRPTADLCAEFYPHVPLRHDLPGFRGLYDCSKAERLLEWTHDTEPLTDRHPHHVAEDRPCAPQPR